MPNFDSFYYFAIGGNKTILVLTPRLGQVTVRRARKWYYPLRMVLGWLDISAGTRKVINKGFWLWYIYRLFLTAVMSDVRHK